MRWFGKAAAVALVPSTVAVGILALTGGMAPLGIVGLPEPGALTRVGLPLVQGIRDLAAALTVGLLVLAAFCVPPEAVEKPDELGGARRRLVDLALAAATAWALTGLLLLGLTYSDASGAAVGSPGFISQAVFFGTDFELGRYLLTGSVLAALVALGCLVTRTSTGTGVLLLLAVGGLWTMALTGHAAGSLFHDTAVDLQFLHLVALCTWVGGLLALAMVRRALGSHLVVTVRRYSTLAAWSLVLVSLSGVAGAVLRVQQVAGLWSSYGAVLAGKVAAVVLLAGLGWWQRRRLIDQLAAGRTRAFGRLVAVEAVVLASATGAGVALSRTLPPPPPGSQEPLTAAESLLGASLPSRLRWDDWFTAWSLDTFWLLAACFLLVWYLRGVLLMRRRGDHWPILRTVCWVIGWLLFIWATNGAPGAYGRVLFSMHMVQHMTIATAAPAFLVLGAPVTLALRTLRRRADGSAGPREWLQRAVLSLPLQILGTPIVAAGLFVVSLVTFYYSSLFAASLESHTAHVAMVGHFLLSGYLFASCLVGIDPGPARPAYPLRVLLVMVTFAFHALFSVSLMASNQVLAADWYAALGRTWGRSSLEDQKFGASIGWALGDYPLAVMAVALIALWVQADRRERRRFDRQEDRDGGRQLAAYNDGLRRLREAGAPVSVGVVVPSGAAGKDHHDDDGRHQGDESDDEGGHAQTPA